MTATLRKAAAYIEKHGWRRGPTRYQMEDGPTTVKEAVSYVAESVADIIESYEDLLCYLQQYRLVEPEGWNRIGAWNDDEYQDGPNVAMHLRAVPEGISQKVTHMVVQGRSGQYTLTLEGRQVSCSCPGFEYRANCRHVTEYKAAA